MLNVKSLSLTTAENEGLIKVHQKPTDEQCDGQTGIHSQTYKPELRFNSAKYDPYFMPKSLKSVSWIGGSYNEN